MAFEWRNPFVTKTIKTIKPGDKMFKIHNGFMTSDRASLEISPHCPKQWADIIVRAHMEGWLTPVAHVTEKEYVLMGLSNDS